MKSTGVIRRIDELGRIVIPKEIRRNLKIRDGENMEIYIDLDSIILKKYSKLDDVRTMSCKIAEIINKLTNYEIVITDRDHIVTCFGEEVEQLKQQSLSHELLKLIDNRETFNEDEKISINLTNIKKLSGYFYIKPIISEADSIGLIILYSKEDSITNAQVIGDLISNLICEQVDIN